MFYNFAHRGASQYAPENTVAAFCLGLEMGANGIETDIQKTKDGTLVLFHDDTLMRMTGQEGSVCDYTYRELHGMDVTLKGCNSVEKIMLFEDFARYFGHKALCFEIELKSAMIEEDVLHMLKAYDMQEKCYITSFQAEALRRVKMYDAKAKTGLIAKNFGKETVDLIKDIRADMTSVLVDVLTPEIVKAAAAMGLRLHAWGIKGEADMKKALDCGAQGMTINFPDMLTGELQARGQGTPRV